MPLIDTTRCAVVLVDYQPRLMAAIDRADEVLASARRLAEVASLLRLPVVGTHQNPDRLGELAPELAGHCNRVLDKMHFDACGGGLLEAVGEVFPDAREFVVAGCETHVCLLQTALTLLDDGYPVWVCADACGSRRAADRELALRRLEGAGAVLVNVEMVAFEGMRTASHPRFRDIQAVIK